MTQVDDHIAELIAQNSVKGKVRFGISNTQALIDAVEPEFAVVDVKTAADLYRLEFLEIPGFDDLPEELHPDLFAIAVEIGVTRAAIVLQSALCEFQPRKTKHINGVLEQDNYADCAELMTRGKFIELQSALMGKFANLCDRLAAKFPDFRTAE